MHSARRWYRWTIGFDWMLSFISVWILLPYTSHGHLHKALHDKSDFMHVQVLPGFLQPHLISSWQAADTCGSVIHTGYHRIPSLRHPNSAGDGSNGMVSLPVHIPVWSTARFRCWSEASWNLQSRFRIRTCASTKIQGWINSILIEDSFPVLQSTSQTLKNIGAHLCGRNSIQRGFIVMTEEIFSAGVDRR